MKIRPRPCMYTLLCKLHGFFCKTHHPKHPLWYMFYLFTHSRAPPKLRGPPYYHKIVYKIANKFLEVMNITAFFPANFCKSSYFFRLFPLIKKNYLGLKTAVTNCSSWSGIFKIIQRLSEYQIDLLLIHFTFTNKFT